MIFGKWARIYYDRGIIPLPLGKPNSGRGGKAAFTQGWQEVARTPYTRETLEEWISKYSDRNIGIACGTILFDDLQLVAIDIDNVDVMDHIQRAMPSTVSGKFGMKGATWFALAPSDFPSRRIHSTTGKKGTAVEILSIKSQTVIPPSVHPDTDKEYTWIGEPLHSVDLRQLPVINEGFINECIAIASGKAQYFIGGELDSKEKFCGINNMTWAGIGGGGNTYDVRLRAIANMVSNGWTDQDIIPRIKRSQREAVEREGQVFDWPDCERETQKQIDDARKKGFGDNKEKEKSKAPIERKWAKWLSNELEHSVSFQGKCFKYIDGHYVEVDKDELESMVVKNFEVATNPKANTAVRTYYNLVHRMKFGNRSSSSVCLLNGTLDTDTCSLRQWSHEDELTYKLDISWSDDSQCPEYDKFVEWVFAGDQQSIDCWDEFCGLTFVNDLSFQKAMFLIGDGSNGKSTLALLLNKIHDQSMVATVGITELSDEKKLSSIDGKYLNISSEQSRINPVTDQMFKMLVSGDPVTVRRLYENPRSNVIIPARFLCLANDLPPINDSSYAIKRRLIILKCPNTKEEGEQDRGLLDKLVEERVGIFKRWVHALKRLRDRGEFDVPESAIQTVNEYVDSNDPVLVWSQYRLIETDKPQEEMVIYGDFVEWSKQNGNRNHMAIQFWRKRMERNGYKPKKVSIGGMNRCVFYYETVTSSGIMKMSEL